SPNPELYTLREFYFFHTSLPFLFLSQNHMAKKTMYRHSNVYQLHLHHLQLKSHRIAASEVLFHLDCFEKSLFPSTNLALIHTGWPTDMHHEPSESLQLIYPGLFPVQQLEHLLWPVQQK